MTHPWEGIVVLKQCTPYSAMNREPTPSKDYLVIGPIVDVSGNLWVSKELTNEILSPWSENSPIERNRSFLGCQANGSELCMAGFQSRMPFTGIALCTLPLGHACSLSVDPNDAYLTGFSGKSLQESLGPLRASPFDIDVVTENNHLAVGKTGDLATVIQQTPVQQIRGVSAAT